MCIFFFNDPNTYLKNKKISSKLKKKLKSFKNTTKLWHLAPGTMGQRAHGQARSSPEKQHVEFRCIRGRHNLVTSYHAL
jgi:hypothetical protein